MWFTYFVYIVGLNLLGFELLILFLVFAVVLVSIAEWLFG